MKTFKPMLAASCDDLDQLRYPLLATPKIDGIRCLIIDGVAMSRSLKPIPNAYIQSVLGKPEFNGLDGELLVGSSFQDATSGIMSAGGEPDFRYYVFDKWDDLAGYEERVAELDCYPACARITQLIPVELRDRAELDTYSAEMLADGHEGIMVRLPDGLYKNGRATFREGYLTKIKPFEDADATVVGFAERMHNSNAATTNALGRTERSSHQANLVPMRTLGALIVTSPLWKETFNIGTGFTDAQRSAVWESRESLIGRTVKFKYQAIGTKDAPRIPVFLGWRDQRDT
jgi:DNA ligase-1